MTLDDKFKDFEDRFNPRHYYCRLRELDVPKDFAIELMKEYEIKTYKKITNYLINNKGEINGYNRHNKLDFK